MISKKPKVAIAMSGGVDSSVSALLLKNKKYDTAGFYMDLGCGSSKNAKNVAGKLKIPFFEVDAKKVFRRNVIGYFISEYKNLRTPNPCVVCNKNIKFGWLLETARKNKFEKLATGHYARIKTDKNGVFHLLTGRDKTKDQSYFLYRLDQSQLSRVIFPLGEMAKNEVKKIAERKRLPHAQGESQEICFLGDMDYRAYLQKNIPKKYFHSGEIVDVKGNIIGQHNGLINYTIGQRKGIEQSGVVSDNKKRLYVIGFNQEKNELVVGENKDLLKKEVVINDLAWVSDWAKNKVLLNKNLKARIRYRHIPTACKIKSINSKKLKIIFKYSQRAIVPGQSLVIYHGEEVLGGGVII